MTIVPLSLSPRLKRQTHRASSLTSGLGAAFLVAALQKHQREGRPRLQVRAQGGAASRARGCLPVAAPRCGRSLPLGAGRPRRPPAGRRARALPRLTGGVRLQVPTSTRRSRRRPAAGRLLSLGARLRGCRGGRSGIRAGGAGSSGAWTRLPAAPGSGSPRRSLLTYRRRRRRRPLPVLASHRVTAGCRRAGA